MEALLERIATALERIADCMGEFPPETAHIATMLEATEANAAEAGSDGETPCEPELPAPANQTRAVLEAFLESKNITIKAVPPEDAADHIIDRLSLYLGERYGALSTILGNIKSTMQNGRSFTLDLGSYAQDDIGSVCQFCKSLHEVAFLESYRYRKAPHYLIHAKAATLSKAQKFFGGQWLERFVAQKVRATHAHVANEVGGPVPFEMLINPQIQLPNGDDFELDVLFAIGQSIYWIEAKTGDYQRHVKKYSDFARTLGLDGDHSWMVLTDIRQENCANLSALFGMKVCNVQSFHESLLEVARTDTALVGGANGQTPAHEPSQAQP